MRKYNFLSVTLRLPKKSSGHDSTAETDGVVSRPEGEKKKSSQSSREQVQQLRRDSSKVSSANKVLLHHIECACSV